MRASSCRCVIPGETIPSLLKLMRLGWRGLDWDEERIRRCLSILAEQSFETYRHPLEVLADHPDVPCAIVDYRDVVADPAGTIEEVYRRLGFTLGEAYREVLSTEGKRARRHVSDHAYSLAEFGLEADVIQTRLADLFERFAWDAPTGTAATIAEEAPR